MVFECLDFAFLLSRFEARRTDVLPAQLDIAEGADETAAKRAGNDCLFLRVKVTARLIIYGKSACGLAGRRFSKKGGKDFNAQACSARRASCNIRGVEGLPLKR
jgi:hypothetical protein